MQQSKLVGTSLRTRCGPGHKPGVAPAPPSRSLETGGPKRRRPWSTQLPSCQRQTQGPIPRDTCSSWRYCTYWLCMHGKKKPPRRPGSPTTSRRQLHPRAARWLRIGGAVPANSTWPHIRATAAPPANAPRTDCSPVRGEGRGGEPRLTLESRPLHRPRWWSPPP
jgi:hypothetical protein